MNDETLFYIGAGVLGLGALGFFAYKMTGDRREFIKKVSAAGLSVSKESGIPLSFIVTQAAHESNWGQSGLTVRDNNLFGIKADSRWVGPVDVLNTKEVIAGKEITVQARWRKYSSWEASIRDWANFLKAERYKDAMKAALNDDPLAFFKALQKAGYATDPAYSDKLAGVYKSVQSLVV